MGFWQKIFKRNKKILPCNINDFCPYDYDLKPDRDIEGMPFIDDDPRSCPDFGHICPEFMEEFGLSIEDLNIRAIVHCASVQRYLMKQGEMDPDSSDYIKTQKEYEDITRKYPEDKFQQYYN